MTQEDYRHPIEPPPELVQQWLNADAEKGLFAEPLAAKAAQWGADQELEACVKWLEWNHSDLLSRDLSAARRPKPPSLKQQALDALGGMPIEPCLINGVDANASVRAKYNTIRRALEQLDD
jgi:hypothetical protein